MKAFQILILLIGLIVGGCWLWLTGHSAGSNGLTGGEIEQCKIHLLHEEEVRDRREKALRGTENAVRRTLEAMQQ